MGKLTLTSKREFKLERLSSNKITITKVKVIKPNENPHLYLGMPIIFETKYPNGSIEKFSIHSLSYFNNNIASARHPATNMKMNVIISHCKHTTAIISRPGADTTEIEFEIEYESVKPVLISIYVSDTIDGFSFELDPNSKTELEEAFPRINIAGRIQIGRETFKDFRTNHGSLTPYILQSLTGLDEFSIKRIDYQIINSTDRNIIYSSIRMR